MAALHISHFFFSRNSSILRLQPRKDPRNALSISCLNRESSNPMEAEAKKDKKENKRNLPQLLLSVDSFGKALRENLSPQKKGDWKDLTYMCLSFALYVYISQKLVCAYCVWMSMTKQPW